MTSALEGGEWSAARPGRTLPPGKTRYPIYRRLGGTQDRSGRAENFVLTGIRSLWYWSTRTNFNLFFMYSRALFFVHIFKWRYIMSRKPSYTNYTVRYHTALKRRGSVFCRRPVNMYESLVWRVWFKRSANRSLHQPGSTPTALGNKEQLEI